MPIININASDAVLTFKSKEAMIDYYTDGWDAYGLNIVKISIDNGSTWTQLWCPDQYELTDYFRTVTLSLENYVNQDILIAFEYRGSNAHKWYVDDVMVKAPFTKEISGYTDESGWYLIASPAEITPSAENGFLANEYDLYQFDQSQTQAEWRNYRQNTFNIVPGTGYLYANSSTVTLQYYGTLYNGDGVIDLTYSEANNWQDMWGWNLVGNPYATPATIDKAYYRMNPAGNELVAGTSEEPVEVMEGIFVKAEEEGQTVTFTVSTGARNSSNDNALVVMNLTQSRGLIDRAIVCFNPSSQLPKFMLDETNTKLYIPQNGKDFAIVNAEAAGEMPVNFKANKDGQYTLTVNAENVEMSYLHLIDNMTGDDVNLLATPSYTFNAKATDFASRFKLVFATGSLVDAESGSFAFMNASGNFAIYGIEGKATLQVVDVLGHVISSEQFSGSYEKHLEAAPGVYMLRLINGDNVMVQKIVVR